MAKITNKQIEHLAELSALEFSEEAKQKMKGDLEQIVSFVDEMNACDTSSILFDDSEVTLTDLRDDKVQKGLSQDEATSNAPSKENGYYIVSKVVD